MPDELREMFEGMLDELDKDLQAKLQKALDNGDTTIEFTPDEFRRFRDNPINPFDDIEDIDADSLQGTIQLKFELPSVRNRPVKPLERQSRQMRQMLKPAVGSASASTVKIMVGDRHVAMGTIISGDGIILTKASEIKKKKDIKCVFGSGQSLPARISRIDSANDLAVLNVDASGLTPVQWSQRQPLLGSFVLTPDEAGGVAVVGCYSGPPRSMVGERAFLGVQPQTASNGVLLDEVTPSSAGAEAGLRAGDVITTLAGVPVRDVTDLVNAIRERKPGDLVAIEYLRGSQRLSTKAKLAGQNVTGERAARFKMMNRLGAIPSRHADEFPVVFQHDSPLFPEQCGGPICDLDGNVLGINIARAGRAATYAIPASHLHTILPDLTRENIAARK
jgi:serine protease Do